MTRIVFLVEEASMKILLDGLLPRLFPGLGFHCVPHEGKRDLEASFPRKLRAWTEPGVRFVILRDNDGADCAALKARLLSLCPPERKAATLVRIVCQELEAWYIGDPAALAAAFEDPYLAGIGNRARFRDPDTVAQPSKAIAELVPAFQKRSGARQMAERLDGARTRSTSFRVFLAAVSRQADQLSTGG